MIEVHKTTVKGKGHNDDQEFLYINLLGFRDKAQRDVIFEKIQELIKDREKIGIIEWWKRVVKK